MWCAAVSIKHLNITVTIQSEVLVDKIEIFLVKNIITKNTDQAVSGKQKEIFKVLKPFLYLGTYMSRKCSFLLHFTPEKCYSETTHKKCQEYGSRWKLKSIKSLIKVFNMHGHSFLLLKPWCTKMITSLCYIHEACQAKDVILYQTKQQEKIVLFIFLPRALETWKCFGSSVNIFATFPLAFDGFSSHFVCD